MPGHVSPGEHALATTWNLWTSRKRPNNSPSAKVYRQQMHLVGSFNTEEGYERLQFSVQVPSKMEPGYSLHCFRKDSRNRKPCWERYPKGGSWTLDLPLEPDVKEVLDPLWNRLVQGLLNESFHDTRVVGAVASRRASKFCISVWHRNCVELDIEALGGRINEIMGVDSDTLLYKAFKDALADGSTRWKAQEYRLAVGPDGHHHPRISSPASSALEPSLVLQRESPAERKHRKELEERKRQLAAAPPCVGPQPEFRSSRTHVPRPIQLDITPDTSPVMPRRSLLGASTGSGRETESERKLAELAQQRLSLEQRSPTSPSSPLSPRSAQLGDHQHLSTLKPMVFPFQGVRRATWHRPSAVYN